MSEPSRLGYLLAQPAFQEHPAKLLYRTALWVLYCAVGYSPRFQLNEKVWLEVDPVLRFSGSASAFVLRQWAEPELRYLDQLLAEGDSFIDCGANIGIYTARAAGIVAARGKVVAVEPGDLSFQRLSRNLEVNRFSHVTAIKKAICDTQSTARLYHADGGPVSFSLVATPDTDFEEVATTTIDQIVTDHGFERLDCIKLDVEGVELLALQGAEHSLARFKPTVIFERWSLGQTRLTTSETVPEHLRARGYEIYAFGGDPSLPTRYESPNLVAIHPQSGKPIPRMLNPWAGP